MGRWELYELLGQGAYGQVFRARLDDGRIVAIKRLDPQRSNDRHEASLQLEAENAHKLAHPNIVSLLDVDTDSDGHMCLIMELVSGVNLAQLLRAGRVPLAASVHIGRSILAALAHAHDSAGLVHCDVSPHNVLISWDGEVKLSDFGIAKAISAHHQKGRIGGKLHYMSPEQYEGSSIDGRSDLFSVGVILYQLLSGHSPYGESDHVASSCLRHQATIPPLAARCPELPPALCAVVMRLLAYQPADRYPSAREALEALPDWAHGASELSGLVRKLRKAGALARRRLGAAVRRSGRRVAALMGAGAAAVLLFGAGGLSAMWMLSRVSPPTPRTIIAPEPVSVVEHAEPPIAPVPGPAPVRERDQAEPDPPCTTDCSPAPSPLDAHDRPPQHRAHDRVSRLNERILRKPTRVRLFPQLDQPEEP